MDHESISKAKGLVEDVVSLLQANGSVDAAGAETLRKRADDNCPELFQILLAYHDDGDAGKLAAAAGELAARGGEGCGCGGKKQKWVHFDIDSNPDLKPEAQGLRAMFDVISGMADKSSK